MVRIHLLLSNRDKGRESRPRHRWFGVDLGPTVTPETPSRLDDRLRASTTTVTTARATTTTVGAGGTTKAMTTASTTGHQTSGVHGLSAGASMT
jgi:hypothetical protein